MKKIFVILALACSCLSFSQITFDKGYFINNNGKRTECFIENFDWHDNPTSFSYKLNENDAESKIENIVGVSEFGIDKESMYRRFNVTMEHSQTVTSYLQKGKNPVMKVETLFLHALVTGEASLYNYVNGNISKFFFETKTASIEQLIFIRYMDEHTENIKESNQFRQQLLNAVKCGNMKDSDFAKIQYNQNSLIRHFLAYNACNGSKTTLDYNAVGERKRDLFAFKITAGAYMATAAVSDPDDYYNMNGDLKQSLFKIGFETEFILPYNKGLWSILINPSYEKFDPVKNFISLTNNPGFANDKQPVSYHAKSDYSSVEIPIGVRRYFFLNKSSKIFANLMYVIDFSNSGNITFTNDSGLANATQAIPLKSKNNFALGLGYNYRRFSGEIRYNAPRKIGNLASWGVDYTTLGLNIGYRIF